MLKTDQFFLQKVFKESSEREIFFKYFPHCIVTNSQKFLGNRIIVEETCVISNLQRLTTLIDIYLSSRQVDFIVEFCEQHFDQQLPPGFVRIVTETGFERVAYGCVPLKIRYKFLDETTVSFTMVCLTSQPLHKIAADIIKNIDEIETCVFLGKEKDDFEAICDDTLLLGNVYENDCCMIFGNK
jgi:hypothetical protein